MRGQLVMFGVALAALLMFSTACQRITYATAPEKGVYAGPVQGQAVGPFAYHQKAHFLFWGLAPIGVPDLATAAASQLKPGQALGNVKIEEANFFVDGLLAGVTLGIYRPRTVDITGTIYQVK